MKELKQQDQEESLLLQELDYPVFKVKTQEYVKKYHMDRWEEWRLFCHYLDLERTDQIHQSEKLILLQTAFQCLKQPHSSGELAQFLTLSNYLKAELGLRIFQLLFNADIPAHERTLENYLTAMQLLLELQEEPGILKCVKGNLPPLSALIENLQKRQIQYLENKYPEKNIDEVISKFSLSDYLMQFPLSVEELSFLKSEYLAVKNELNQLEGSSLPAELDLIAQQYGRQWEEENDLSAKYRLIALLCKTIRHVYKIAPYDTQILSLLALINTPEKLKGRIAQIKTGEGKSTIIALLAAIMGCRGHFVDIVTSSANLAIRDCAKYRPFFEALGLTASHICDQQPNPSHFEGQILYGTNTDFEFALLREGLYNQKLRYSEKGNLKDSKNKNQVQLRPFDVVIVDEVDNLFLDTALNSALMSIPGTQMNTWIYESIFSFVKDHLKQAKISNDEVENLRISLMTQWGHLYSEQIASFTQSQLKKWMRSSQQALYEKVENKDYVVKQVKQEISGEAHAEIVIVDYLNTGRRQEGSQWRGGLHQFLQVKHQLKVTPESFTAASMSHPTYFNLYKHILGLTGTLGEVVEVKEIQTIYSVDCFTVPPHFPSLRKHLPPLILGTNEDWHAQLMQRIDEMQKSGRPVLVLFETIQSSEEFSQLLKSKGIAHQVINENQRESEDYLIGRAGNPGMVTIATNTAGRGTDILISKEVIEAGGLHMIFAFYPSNLRVEGQGFGRAGRQGQSGSCEMILSLQDKYVKSWLAWYANAITLENKEYYSSNKKEKIRIDHVNAFILIIQQKGRGLSAGHFLQLLNEFRSEQIQQDSKHRYQCSQQEAIYFEKLQDFFEKIKTLYQLFEDNTFRQRFIEQCKCHAYSLNQTALVLNEHWQPLCNTAKHLLKQHHEGIKPDWSYFFTNFQEVYLDHIRREWALFYNRLHEEVDRHDILEVQKQVDQFYLNVQSNLDRYFSNPEEGILNLLNDLFCEVDVVLYLEGQTILSNSPFSFINSIGQIKDLNIPKLSDLIDFSGVTKVYEEKIVTVEEYVDVDTEVNTKINSFTPNNGTNTN